MLVETVVGLVLITTLARAEPPHNNDTTIHEAAAIGDVIAVKKHLDKGVNLDVRDKLGRTPLKVAAISAKTEVVALLLKEGADVDARANCCGGMALHHVVFTGNKEIVDLLLKNKADVNAKDWAGNTPLQGAVIGEHIDMANLLLIHGANPNVTDRKGTAPLQTSVANGNAEMAQVLISHGAELDVPDGGCGATPLHYTAEQGVRELGACRDT